MDTEICFFTIKQNLTKIWLLTSGNPTIKIISGLDSLRLFLNTIIIIDKFLTNIKSQSNKLDDRNYYE